MAEEGTISTRIFDPAAVVRKVGSKGRGGGALPPVDTSKVSALSRARAANGDTRLSFETQEAIKRGAQAPFVAKKEEESPPSEISEEAQALAETGAIPAAGFAPGAGSLAGAAQAAATSVDVGGSLGGNVNIVV